MTPNAFELSSMVMTAETGIGSLQRKQEPLRVCDTMTRLCGAWVNT